MSGDPYPDWPADLDEHYLSQEEPEQLSLPGLPAGFLAYQINYTCARGCNHNSSGSSVDGGGRGQEAVKGEER